MYSAVLLADRVHAARSAPACHQSPSGPLPRLIVGNRRPLPVVPLLRSSTPLCEGNEERRTGRSYPASSGITSSCRRGARSERAASAGPWRAAPARDRSGQDSVVRSPGRRGRSEFCSRPTPAGLRKQRTAAAARDRRGRRSVAGDRAPAGPCAVAAGGRRRQTDHPAVGFALPRYRHCRHAGRRRRARAERGPARGHPACDAGDLVEHFADDAPREERVPARTGDGRAFIDTAPGGRGSGACQAMRLAGDPHLRNGVRDENVGAERRARP